MVHTHGCRIYVFEAPSALCTYMRFVSLICIDVYATNVYCKLLSLLKYFFRFLRLFLCRLLCSPALRTLRTSALVLRSSRCCVGSNIFLEFGLVFCVLFRLARGTREEQEL